MNLLRLASRTMLAGYFVFRGQKALREPEEFVSEAERFADTAIPLAQKVAPSDVADKIPTETTTLVRISGGLQVLGGLALATGKGRRLGAGLLAASLVPQLIAHNPFEGDVAPTRNSFLTDLALLGGVLIAAQDTEGKPGLTWRAKDTSKKLQSSAEQTKKQLAYEAKLARANVEKAFTEAENAGLELKQSLR